MKDCLRAYFKTKTVPFVYSTVPDNATMPSNEYESDLENKCNESKYLNIPSKPEVTGSHPKDIDIDAKCNQEEENNESKVSRIVL